jgi:hypothetical protein
MPKGGGQEYSIKLKSLESLQACLDEIRSNRKLYLTKIRPTRQEANLKMCKKVELTNLVLATKSSANPEVLIFNSLNPPDPHKHSCYGGKAPFGGGSGARKLHNIFKNLALNSVG